MPSSQHGAFKKRQHPSLRHYLTAMSDEKIVEFKRKRAVSNNFCLAPGLGYGVFVRVHIGYQTRIIFFARFRAD